MGMDGPAYRETVRRAREHIERGTAEDLKTAEEESGGGWGEMSPYP